MNGPGDPRPLPDARSDPGSSRPVSGLRLRTPNQHGEDGLPDDATRDHLLDLDPRRHLLCARCGMRITNHAWRIRVAAGHEHTLFNPHGVVFHIGCFARAPGCITRGPESREFTWFKDHGWTLAGCSRCRIHLGWRFRHDSATTFFGLVLNRLKEGKTD